MQAGPDSAIAGRGRAEVLADPTNSAQPANPGKLRMCPSPRPSQILRTPCGRWVIGPEGIKVFVEGGMEAGFEC